MAMARQYSSKRVNFETIDDQLAMGVNNYSRLEQFDYRLKPESDRIPLANLTLTSTEKDKSTRRKKTEEMTSAG